MNKKIVIAAGGSGGHLFPAQAVAANLRASHPNCQIVFMGEGLSKSRFFTSLHYTMDDISSSSITPSKFWRLPKQLFKVIKGFFQARQKLKSFAPDLVVGFGSFHTFPILLAAKWLNIPFILHEANSVPGKVNRIFSPYAISTAVFFDEAKTHLKGKVQLTDIPLFSALQKKGSSKSVACEYFQLEPYVFTLFVCGGSQGAKFLNHLALEAVKKLKLKCQVLHITGSLNNVQDIESQYKKMGVQACIKPFETRMDLAWKMSDFAITRSGAGTVAEMIHYGVPCLFFIPYPYATDHHQKKNADWVVKIIGGAMKIEEKEVEAAKVAEIIERLFAENGSLYRAMKKALIHFRTQNPPLPFHEVIEYYVGIR